MNALDKSQSQSSMELYWSTKTHGLHRLRSEKSLKTYAEELLAIIPHRGVLFDVGCGACEITTYLAPHFDKVFGIDFSDSMLAAAHQRIVEMGITNIDLLKGTMTSFPVTEQKPDVILSYAVVQYLDPEEVRDHLQACRRALNGGGVVCVGLVPDPARKNAFYARLFPDRSNLRRRLDIIRFMITQRLRKDPIVNGIGYWHSPSEITRVTAETGFEADIHRALFADYRFHALLRSKSDERR